MQMVLDIPATLIDRVRRYAEQRGQRVEEFVADALEQQLDDISVDLATAPPHRMVTFKGDGLVEGIDLTGGSSLQDAMDNEVRDPNTGVLDITRLR